MPRYNVCIFSLGSHGPQVAIHDVTERRIAKIADFERVGATFVHGRALTGVGPRCVGGSADPWIVLVTECERGFSLWYWIRHYIYELRRPRIREMAQQRRQRAPATTDKFNCRRRVD